MEHFEWPSGFSVYGDTRFERLSGLSVSHLYNLGHSKTYPNQRVTAAKRSESPATLLEQLKRIHQQTVQTADGKTLTGLTEMTPAQKSLFAALELALPTPENLTKPVL